MRDELSAVRRRNLRIADEISESERLKKLMSGRCSRDPPITLHSCHHESAFFADEGSAFVFTGDWILVTGVYLRTSSSAPSGRKYCVPRIGSLTRRSRACRSSLRSTKSISEVLTISKSDEV